MTKNTKRLYRSEKNRIIGGVCAGMGDYFSIDPVMIRLVWALCALVWGFGVFVYILAWIIIPRGK